MHALASQLFAQELANLTGVTVYASQVVPYPPSTASSSAYASLVNSFESGTYRGLAICKQPFCIYRCLYCPVFRIPALSSLNMPFAYRGAPSATVLQDACVARGWPLTSMHYIFRTLFVWFHTHSTLFSFSPLYSSLRSGCHLPLLPTCFRYFGRLSHRPFHHHGVGACQQRHPIRFLLFNPIAADRCA